MMGRYIRNEKGLTLIEMLVGILIFSLATVFIVSGVVNAMDKPKVAGIKGSLNYYEKGASVLLLGLPSGVSKEELLAGFNEGLDSAAEFTDGKSSMVNAYGKPYEVNVVVNELQTAVVVESKGKKIGEVYRVVVLKEEGTVESCTVGFGRNDKSLMTMQSELCGVDDVTNEEMGNEITDEQIKEAFTWVVNSDGNSVTVTGYTGSLGKEIKIPLKFEGKIVTGIGTHAFHSKQLMGVTIPETVTSIGSEAFSINQLRSIVIPDGVTTIGKYAFSYNQLTSVVIPNKVTSISNSTFSSNQLTSVEIPDSVKIIGNQAFMGNQLSSVVIPNSVTSIGYSAFMDNSLTSVVIPDTVMLLGSEAFSDNKLTSVTISNRVTNIWAGTFSNNQLTSVDIPDSVTHIGNGAFRVNQLTSVHIPNKDIGEYENAFDIGVVITKGY